MDMQVNRTNEQTRTFSNMFTREHPNKTNTPFRGGVQLFVRECSQIRECGSSSKKVEHMKHSPDALKTAFDFFKPHEKDMTMIETLPAGSVHIGAGVHMHVAELRQYTADVHRFQRRLPTALELQKHSARSPAWCAIVDSLGPVERQELSVTLKELGDLQQATAGELDGAA